MNILVTGATGFVGSHLLDRLQTGRHRVRCMVAPFEMKAAQGLKSRGFEAVVADIMNRDEIRRAIPEGLDAVFHLAGILTETRKVKFVDIHVNATRNLVDACVEKNLKRFIFTSAFGAAPDAESALHRSKWECERLLRMSGLEYTILRPTIIFGRGDRFTNLFAYEIRNHPFIPIPDGGRNAMQPIFVDDLAEAMVRCLRRDDTRFGAYDLGGHETYTFREMVKRIYKVVGIRRRMVPVPIPLMYVMGFFYELFSDKPMLTRDLVTLLKKDYVAPGNAITEVFGIKPVGFVEGMRTYLRAEAPHGEWPRKAA
ncbi:MAG TPA: complex I NDUFA9 subunit family protein [Thermodesulfobacteriota bacterium]